MLAFSTFGHPPGERSARVQEAVRILDSRRVDFEYDGEMAADVALNPELMAAYPFCRLSGPANVLIMPAFHSAAISTRMLQELGGAHVIGPILVGLDRSVQIQREAIVGVEVTGIGMDEREVSRLCHQEPAHKKSVCQRDRMLRFVIGSTAGFSNGAAHHEHAVGYPRHVCGNGNHSAVESVRLHTVRINNLRRTSVNGKVRQR
jgi:hypothetical protein